MPKLKYLGKTGIKELILLITSTLQKHENNTDIHMTSSDKSAVATIPSKAPLNSPTFTGIPKAPTAVLGTNTEQIATTAFVKNAVDKLLTASEAMTFKGTLGTNGTITALPNVHNVGDTYKIVTAGTYAGNKCEIGDMIICVQSGEKANNSDWTVVQANLDGTVTSSATSVTANTVPIFDGTTGRIIKSSGFTIGVSVPSNAVFTDNKVTNTANNSAKAYVTGTTSGSTNTSGQIFDTGIYIDTAAGTLVASVFKGSLSGNASTATKLQTARSIGISGGATGTATSFNGSSDITIPVTSLNTDYLVNGVNTLILDGGIVK